MSISQIPTKEVQQDEVVTLANTLANGHPEYMDMALLHASCILSQKYKIDIHKFMWNILGKRRGKYENMLHMFNNHGVKYHQVTV